MIKFPDPNVFTGMDGIVYVGGTLETENLFRAYSKGIFPWPIEDLPMLWHCPDRRGILEFKDLHIPKSLKRVLNSDKYSVRFNTEFEIVIRKCSEAKRKGQDSTWILPHMVDAYIEFHKEGYAHSVECFNQDDQLVGGLYGVYVKGVFSGESMFFDESNAGKVCLVRLVERLRQFGMQWIDIQMVTAASEQFGGKYVRKSVFLKKLREAQTRLPKKIKL